jgi:LuxR family maltose regulon positive regulatory protein
MPDDSLLTTKLHIPSPRPDLVSRPRLVEHLTEGLRRKLTLVSAPPGFGKTTLVSTWLRQIDLPLPVAWLSLDERDNNPARFWTYLLAALRQIDASIGSMGQTILNAGHSQVQTNEALVTMLINDLAAVPGNYILVLEDYHLIEAEAIHTAMGFLLDHAPGQMHLVLISRTDPPFPLTRLRVRDELTELGEADLRFTPAEAVVFLNQTMGLDLDPVDVAALEARTEGWVAGLQLAALSMHGRRDTHSFVQAFTGSHRYVIDYLAEEVLSRQPAHIRGFLLQTSILDRLSGPLCDAVIERLQIDASGNGASVNDGSGSGGLSDNGTSLGQATGQAMLEYLEQANLFIIPLDDGRRWYRYHHLFADFLREHLQKLVSAAELIALHHRACAWYAQQGLYVEAVDHALAAQDPEQAAPFIEQLALSMLTQGEVSTLQNWLLKLPARLIQTRPRLSLAWAWAKVITNEWDDVEPLLQWAERSLAGDGRDSVETGLGHDDAYVSGLWGEVAAIRSMILGNTGEVEQAIALSRQALEQLPEDNLILRSVITMNLGAAYELIGDLAGASQKITEAIAIAETADNLITVLSGTGSLAQLHEEQGRLHHAAKMYQQAIRVVEKQAEARGHPGRPLPIAGWAYSGLAEILREQNQLEAAQPYLVTCLELASHGDIILRNKVIGQLILARIRQAQGGEADAMAAIEEAARLTHRRSPLTLWVEAVRTRLWLMQGNLQAAAHWARSWDLPVDDGLKYAVFPGEYSTLVRVFVAQERLDEAAALLARMHAVAESSGRLGRLLELLILQALILYRQGDVTKALAPLAHALSIAERGGYVRIFVDEGAPMAALLQEATVRDLASTYGYQLLAVFDPNIAHQGPNRQVPGQTEVQVSPLLEPLSDRELEVLRLVASGLSNQDIADRLVIAVSTVKSHTNKIFGKLAVQNRTQAVAKARDLGLL